MTSLLYSRCLSKTFKLQNISLRSFGFGTNWPETSRHQKNKSKKRSKAKFAHDPRSKDDTIYVPPACLLPTASPYAYIAKSAAIRDQIDPKSIFAHTSPDSLLRNGAQRFQYFEHKPADETSHNTLVPEVAFLGRSNVGKSSLQNSLMQRKLARTSKRPGRTQQAHYFGLVDDKERIHGYLVDLPGYGYAVGPDEAVDVWQSETQKLLLARRDSQHLQRLYLLIDARHGCLEFDFSIMGWLDEANIPYSIVFTKIDSATAPMRIKWINQVCMRYEHLVVGQQGECSMHPLVFTTSASDGAGLLELRMSIDEGFQGIGE